MSESNLQPTTEPTSLVRWLFFWLVVAGLALRGVAAVYSMGVNCPDEHQQYLEQAQKLAFGGPAKQFWEQERGMRNLFFPYLLAGLLLVLETVGIADPLVQAACLRFILGAIIFLLFAWLAWRDVRRGQPLRGLALVFLAGLTVGFIYINVRLLSENALMIPLLLALLCLDRWPGLAGVCLGVMFAIRFQSAFLILGFGLVALVDDIRAGRLTLSGFWKTPTFRMGLGLLLAVGLTVGLLDRLTLGEWFHSPLENFRANIVENRAAEFGVSPWYTYFVQVGGALLATSLFAPIVLVVGALRDWRLTLVAALMFVGHSFIAHKEFRFLWGALPLALILMARGAEVCWEWLGAGRRRALLTSLAVLSVVGGDLLCLPYLRWNTEPYCSSALALTEIGRQPDVTGVAVGGVGVWDSGNYFYLRRDVPLLYLAPEALQKEQEFVAGTINYLVLPSGSVPSFPHRELEAVATHGELTVWRIHRKRAA